MVQPCCLSSELEPPLPQKKVIPDCVEQKNHLVAAHGELNNDLRGQLENAALENCKRAAHITLLSVEYKLFSQQYTSKTVFFLFSLSLNISDFSGISPGFVELTGE